MRTLLAILGWAALMAPSAFASETYEIAEQMLRDAKAEAHFKALDLPGAIMLVHRQSGLLCQFDTDNTAREVSGDAASARCRGAGFMGDYVLTARRGAKTLQAEHADLRISMAKQGALAPPLCDLDDAVPFCQVSATRREASGDVHTEAFVGVRDGWVFTVRGVGKPGQRIDIMARSTFKGMVDTPEP